jgi:uncharacterized RDD family membrane protein YckC
VATFTADVETRRTADESYRIIAGYLATKGYAPKGDGNRIEWRKGVYWIKYVTFGVADGRASLRAWINLPYPGMGSYLKYFLGRNELKTLVSELEAALRGSGQLPAFAAPAGASSESATGELPVEGAPSASSASFARRAAALLVDLVAVQFAAVPLLALLMLVARSAGPRASGDIAVAALLLLFWLYFAGLESSKHQATWGKRLLGIKVCDLQCQRISLTRASGRFFGKLLSALIYGIGFLIAPFNRRKQALHDLMASTLVVVR